MFTGIIEEQGTVRKMDLSGSSGSIIIAAYKVLEGTEIGDSIAVNGVCLTVTSLQSDSFKADVMAETVRRSSLASLTCGSRVNLERAMLCGGRFGGHIVSGHIDGIGKIKSMKREQNAVWITIETTAQILKFIVMKGSIAIDGISLTVAGLGESDFSVSIIPHTGQETGLLQKKTGDIVNLENDIVGKYVERFLHYDNNEAAENKNKEQGISMDMLRDLGF